MSMIFSTFLGSQWIQRAITQSLRFLCRVVQAVRTIPRLKNWKMATLFELCVEDSVFWKWCGFIFVKVES
jgi:hypothetical protein